MKFSWIVAPPQPELAAEIAAQFRLPPLLAQCLLNRGLSQAPGVGRFLEPRLKCLADPFLLPNLEAAVERLVRARERNESLVIFGDYDVDGVTSTALLVEVLSGLGWKVHYYLPHRLDEGYGLTQEAVENCLARFPVKLLLAVDCGSTAIETIAWLGQRGTDVIVLDHHQGAPPHPAAVALVNPQLSAPAPGAGTLEDGTRPALCPPSTAIVDSPLNPRSAAPDFTELCSVGLSFKLAHALVKRGREAGWPEAERFDVRPLLDLVALGTIADVVPLTGENRILVSAGLARLADTCRPGLVALKRVARCGENPEVYEVGFQLAPRLNAAGRLETAEEALHLLLARTVEEASPIAAALDARNRQRQTIERAIVDEVLAMVQASFKPEDHFVIVEGNARWHVGVVGIVASRVVQQFFRPTIVVGGDGNRLRGSGRSIPGFDLAAALRDCAGELLRHGGHAMAAGVSILPEKVDAFRNRFNEVARRRLSPETLQPRLRLDGEVKLGEMTPEMLNALGRLKPLGQGNPGVQLCARKLVLKRTPLRMGAERQHVKMWVGDGTAICEAVWWGAGQRELPSGRFDLAFVPQLNEYGGRTSVQLKVLDWQAA